MEVLWSDYNSLGTIKPHLTHSVAKLPRSHNHLHLEHVTLGDTAIDQLFQYLFPIQPENHTPPQEVHMVIVYTVGKVGNMRKMA